MFFWFKKNKVVLDCFTVDSFTYNYCKIDKATNFYPEWWKKLDTKINNRPTMKHCRGFTRLYTNSFIIPCWEDMQIKLFANDYSWVNSRLPDSISSHSEIQYKGFIDTSRYQHIKIPSPWYLKSNRFVEFAFTDPIWNRSNVSDYTVLPGVVDYKYQPDTAVNLLIEYTEEGKIIEFCVGEPLVCLTPLTEVEVDIRTHLIDRKDLGGLVPSNEVGLVADISKKYSIRKKFINNIDKNKKKCPFGFGNNNAP